LLHLIRATKINANGSHARHFLVTAISRLCIMWRRKERCDVVSDVLTYQNRQKNYAKNRFTCISNPDREMLAEILAKPGQKVSSAPQVTPFPILIHMYSMRIKPPGGPASVSLFLSPSRFSARMRTGFHHNIMYFLMQCVQAFAAQAARCSGFRFTFSSGLHDRGAFTCKQLLLPPHWAKIPATAKLIVATP
jgi:hypothetical protein